MNKGRHTSVASFITKSVPYCIVFKPVNGGIEQVAIVVVHVTIAWSLLYYLLLSWRRMDADRNNCHAELDVTLVLLHFFLYKWKIFWLLTVFVSVSLWTSLPLSEKLCYLLCRSVSVSISEKYASANYCYQCLIWIGVGMYSRTKALSHSV